MGSVVVQFRLDEEKAEFLRRHGVDLNRAARDQVEGLYRSYRVGEAFDDVRRHVARKSFDVVKAVHEAREDLDRRLKFSAAPGHPRRSGRIRSAR